MVKKKLSGIAHFFSSKILRNGKKKKSCKENNIQLGPRTSIDNNQVTNIDEELKTDEEESHSHKLPNFIRRFSAIDSVVQEARAYSKHHTIVSNIDSSDEDNFSSKTKNFSKF